MGEINQNGRAAFFPVGILIKTPIPFLLLALVGSACLLRRARREDEPLGMVPPLAAALIVLACVPSAINIGMRHVLPIFPLLAICAGVGAHSLWRWRGNENAASRMLVLALLGWQIAAGVRAHPDYLAYFNECCTVAPERWLVDSDLDWGQDLNRLSQALKAHKADHVYLAYFGGADPTRHGLPPFKRLDGYKRVQGWVAISEWHFAAGTQAAPYDYYRWLLEYEPVARVGKSIRLYYIP